jgi:hypothetical protein
MRVGNVAHDEVGEHHWHGAEADTTMSHITITLRLILCRARYLTVSLATGCIPVQTCHHCPGR